jgi:t-SNARE complex subunit (syntaxin)
VEQYEAPIRSIEHGSDQAHNNVADAVKEVEPAILSARAHNRNRKWCFLILGFFILVTVVVSVVVTLVTKNTTRA